MGFAVGLITPLVVGALIDRKTITAPDLCFQFNQFFSQARDLLVSMESAYEPIIAIDDLPKNAELVKDSKLLDALPDDLFEEFAGQGRLRWYRGVAHPILAGIERSYAAEADRGWLEHSKVAKAALVLSHTRKGFNVVDGRLLWQVTGAFLLIYGNLAAGFWISYFTPTVGMGCRAFGYLIFGILIMVVAIGEVILEAVSTPSSAIRHIGHFTLAALESLNVCWLLGTTIAQTFGFYQTCFCESAGFDRRGGYTHFDDIDHDDSEAIIIIWSLGTGAASVILLGSLAYFIVEWLEQSHLMTADFGSAPRGLLWTRRFRRVCGWL
jgi:hypothetical protein